MNLQEELQALKERIAELEELAKEEQEFPRGGDEYWFMSDSGFIGNSFYSNYYIDNDRLEIGNFFKDGEQAEFAVEKLKVEAELRKYSKPFECGKVNHCLLYDTDSDYLEFDIRNYYMAQGAIYFESAEKVRQAVSEIGEERIKKYIFGVEG